ncbi:hybrid sensor histidine kinase/response regulator [Novosphingobium sp. FSY-8]|uniref:histidine kinase n=1 Tax=Novosphingobium ovatum TaxID=1908523 RepID=A0ABW9XEB0_9SPHN|nr:PAS-domain containing protein [Novosphingobium ovatum]NBC36876.1 hybrid sensor histidine kinase/response regulator [Novosphingobium ovatum]
MSVGWVALFALAWIGILFAVAALAEARNTAPKGALLPLTRGRSPRLRLIAYTLALGVYCSSWTIYGAVGSAVRDGWNYLPIYLAPILLLCLAPRFLSRLSAAVAEEQATTVSDFIAARFGHDGVVARLVTLIALAGTVPYMALQLRSIGTAAMMLTGAPVMAGAMMAAAVVLAAFAILFGARRFERAGRSEGMVYAIGLESLIKITALLLVAGLAVSVVSAVDEERLQAGLSQLANRFQPGRIGLETMVISAISALAVLVLPRQFYMGLVEAREPADLPRARWGVAAYLAVMALAVLPIALAGVVVMGDSVRPDFYVLGLPLATGHGGIAIAALIGGISAAAAMVVTDATALATMVSNDLLFPTLIRSVMGRGGQEGAGSDLAAGALGRRMLLVRRATILGVVALALAWAQMVSARESLASIGLVAFAAMAQFSPHLVLAVSGGPMGRRRDPIAARLSLMTGFALWFYTLALPMVLPDGWREWLAGTALDPLRLFGIGRAGPIVHGVFWSLGANMVVYAAVAARRMEASPLPLFERWQRRVTDLSDLRDLTASFIGRERAEIEFPSAQRGMPVDRRSAQRARALIAAVVGTSSARALVASALAGGTMSLADVTRLLDERSHSLGFSRALLAATFENMDSGISVVDAELNLVAWNSRYEQLFAYPPGLLYVGAPVANLIRHNAMRGDFGPGDVETHVIKRLTHLRRGQEYTFERHRPDGRVIKMVGGPMPGGGYVTSFIDITGEARMRAALEQALTGLEARVVERTAELSEANRRLAQADRDKTRFLAAASHDLLQPLHAARLFSAALGREVPAHAQGLVGRVDSAILAAEDLLRALLDISKYDAGGVMARPEPLALGPFLHGLVEGLRPMADAKHLRLRLVMPGDGVTLHTDPGLLRSLLQNFLVNALRYTVTGGVVVGVRLRGRAAARGGGAMARIDVVDTGVGIAPDQIEAIFGEFTRLGEVEAEGLGLGLALSRRISRLLGARIEVVSNPGRGSRFSLWLPLDMGLVAAPVALAGPVLATGVLVPPQTVLVLDNDPRTVEATTTLLAAMGHHPLGAYDGDSARALARAHAIDAMLADFRLTGASGDSRVEAVVEEDAEVGEDDALRGVAWLAEAGLRETGRTSAEDGLDVVASVRAMHPDLPALLITAESHPAIRARATDLGVAMHAKPISPQVIEVFMAQVAARKIG